MNSSLQVLKAEVIDKIEASRVESSERIEKVETTLLTEFHKCAVPIESRIEARK
jgi:hypothetical protein